MSQIIYKLAVSFYHLFIRLAAFFKPKAKAWVEGRKDNIDRLKAWRSAMPQQSAIIWVHCASLGEFEQGRAVIEQLKKDFPDYKIALSFYSPSGYEQRKDYAYADWVGYLPADGKARAQEWLDILQPSLAIFVKYEFWAAHLTALFDRQIPTYLIAASFRKDQLFFKSYGGFFQDLLKGFTHIYTQTKSDLDLLRSIGIQAASVAGDPRLDRVLAIAAEAKSIPIIEKFRSTDKLLIAGSSWPMDEDILLANQKHWEKDWKLLIVPHEIGEAHIHEICFKIKLPYMRFSQIQADTSLKDLRIIVLDRIGMLSHLYRYGDLAYIGGGFGSSIHNTLEPAAFGLPIIFGPRYKKFPEAVAFVASQAAFVIHNGQDFQKTIETLKQDKARSDASEQIRNYTAQQHGATSLIVQGIARQAQL